MPGTHSKLATDKEHPNERGSAESDICNNGTDREQSANGERAAKDEKKHDAADHNVEPHGVDGSPGVWIDLALPFRTGEDTITSVDECNTRSRNHAALAHKEACDDGERQYRQGCLRR